MFENSEDAGIASNYNTLDNQSLVWVVCTQWDKINSVIGNLVGQG